MYVKALYQVLLRLAIIGVCGFATWTTIRIAVADWIASEGTGEAYEKALRLAPDSPDLLVRAAMYRIATGDAPESVDRDLERAARLNPLDAGPLMALGLAEEFRGNYTKAEGYLVHAVELDRQFKPLWTLANYYFRRNEPEKSWPLIQRILNLEPLGYDSTPVFNLCWTATTDSGKILSLMPHHGRRPLEYLQYLMNTKRVDAALEAWPGALAAANADDKDNLAAFADFLAGADRVTEAVSVWNELIDHGFLQYARLDPRKGVSLADPEFTSVSLTVPPYPKAFGWRLIDNGGVFITRQSAGLRFELSGDEPYNFTFMLTFAPVLSKTSYRLRWKGEGSALSAPNDPGFAFRIFEQPGDTVVQCPPMLVTNTCEFTTMPEINKIHIDLRYDRAQGTTRPSGMLDVSSVRLEFAR